MTKSEIYLGFITGGINSVFDYYEREIDYERDAKMVRKILKERKENKFTFY